MLAVMVAPRASKRRPPPSSTNPRALARLGGQPLVPRALIAHGLRGADACRRVMELACRFAPNLVGYVVARHYFPPVRGAPAAAGHPSTAAFWPPRGPVATPAKITLVGDSRWVGP